MPCEGGAPHFGQGRRGRGAPGAGPGAAGMYTLTRGPSKLATQRRTGPTQQAVESSKLGELRGRLQPGAWPPASPAQKLVFNRVNGKRPQVLLPQVSAPEECYTLAHEENVRFIYEACLGWEGALPKPPTACLCPLPSLAAGRAAAGWQPQRGERLWACAVRGEESQPWTEKLCSH
ncbi:MAPK regulated corepressor interacting protein 2 isoform X1 [Melanerpes formicivorus]|uniref:MAPK regulated corepressor interacting protein 2 isoform X1 n=1 Tax=Melanerpes formicivorus TaxID=211600 RepID=UPI00358E727F